MKECNNTQYTQPRTGHCSAMHANHLYVFGGFELTKSSDDEWVRFFFPFFFHL